MTTPPLCPINAVDTSFRGRIDTIANVATIDCDTTGREDVPDPFYVSFNVRATEAFLGVIDIIHVTDLL